MSFHNPKLFRKRIAIFKEALTQAEHNKQLLQDQPISSLVSNH